MNLPGATDRFVHEIDVLQQLHIDSGYFSSVMATQNMIHLVQRHEVIITCIIAIADSQSFIGTHVEEGKFGVRKLVRTRGRGKKQSAADQQKPDNGRFQERSTGPRPGL